MYIQVIGYDRLKHLAQPHDTHALCGEKILSKVIPKDSKQRYTCIKCDYDKRALSESRT